MDGYFGFSEKECKPRDCNLIESESPDCNVNCQRRRKKRRKRWSRKLSDEEDERKRHDSWITLFCFYFVEFLFIFSLKGLDWNGQKSIFILLIFQVSFVISGSRFCRNE